MFLSLYRIAIATILHNCSENQTRASTLAHARLHFAHFPRMHSRSRSPLQGKRGVQLRKPRAAAENHPRRRRSTTGLGLARSRAADETSSSVRVRTEI